MMTWTVLPGRMGLAWLVIVTVWTSVVQSLESDLSSLGSRETEETPGTKRAAFSAWAGKREILGNFPDSDFRLKRPAFNAWAGKRDVTEGEDNKRAAFSAWAGKRSVENEFSDGKRAAFNAWAGKRSFGLNSEDDKRAAFSAWAGKRDSSQGQDPPEDKRAMSFSSWAGKRSDGLGSDDQGESPDELDTPEKKAAFSSWAGKRGYPESRFDFQLLDWYLSKALAKVMEKRKFSVWAGKRNAYRGVVRRMFGPWSG